MTFLKKLFPIRQLEAPLFPAIRTSIEKLLLICLLFVHATFAQNVRHDVLAGTVCPNGAPPSPPSSSIQFNNNGSFGGDPNLLWHKVNKLLTVGEGPSSYPSLSAATSGLRITGSRLESSILEIHNNYAEGVDLYTHADAGFRAPYINLFKSGGTQTLPTAVTYTGYEEESIGGINFGGWDGSGYATSAAIYSQNDENWTPTARGAHLAIYYTGVGGVNTREVAQFGGADPTGIASDNIIFYDPLTWGGNDWTNPAIYPSSTGSASIPPLLAVRTGNNSADAALTALTFRTPVRVFSALVTCESGTEGMTAAVSDSTTKTWGAIITGGGSAHVLAYCDGTNWTVAAR
jgi:hypothetical protein